MNIDLFGNLIVEEVEEIYKSPKINPFEYNQAISDKKYPESFKDYSPWLTNSSFSQRKDTVIVANEINKYHRLGNREQFDFYYHTLQKKKYFAKWAKAHKSNYEKAIMEYYNVGPKKAKEYERVLKQEQLDYIQKWSENKEGGK